MLLEGLVVHSNAKGNTNFVSTGIALSDGLPGVVHLAGNEVSLQTEL